MSKLRLLLFVVIGWLVVSLIALASLLVFNPSGHKAANPPTTSAGAPTPAASTPSSLPDGWIQQAADSPTDCAAHSYGKIKAFLTANPCAGLHRLLAVTTQNGRQIVIASHQITFAAAGTATKYLQLVTADGTGNVNNLLTEGARIPGGPTSLPATAAFASRQSGAEVQVAEAAYLTGTTPAGDATLKALAAQAIA